MSELEITEAERKAITDYHVIFRSERENFLKNDVAKHDVNFAFHSYEKKQTLSLVC